MVVTPEASVKVVAAPTNPHVEVPIRPSDLS